MSSPKFLTRLEGTTVTLSPSPELPLHVGPKRWEIVSEIHERANIVSQRDATNGLGPAYVAGKFLCRPASPSSPNKLAFMRIHKQIPIAGTEFEKTPIRATQAVKSYEPKELTALKSLEERGCDVIPRLLGYQCDQQDEDDIIPGGFVTYVMWAKVPGEPLDMQVFWSCSFSQRQEIRLKFREVYKKLEACGYSPLPQMRKIIYDWSTQMMHLSGFSRPIRTTEGTQWSDLTYVNYGLVRPPTSLDQFFPITSVDLQYDDNGWRW
ncbi:hypothetical protein PITC_010080 [Penicillium italicum]|uniref:Uncharacterized protein n=1 Tax=Penicillium italicum TaxID=40296 RepID=A0A0A2LEV7_PENIT|nr:hypothetical protein PITC_010080 [Penicillium italicum]